MITLTNYSSKHLFRLETLVCINSLTFLQHKATRMIEDKVSEVVAVGINARFLAEAGGAKERERLQRPKGCLALGHRCGTAGHCNRQRRQFSFVANPL